MSHRRVRTWLSQTTLSTDRETEAQRGKGWDSRAEHGLLAPSPTALPQSQLLIRDLRNSCKGPVAPGTLPVFLLGALLGVQARLSPAGGQQLAPTFSRSEQGTGTDPPQAGTWAVAALLTSSTGAPINFTACALTHRGVQGGGCSERWAGRGGPHQRHIGSPHLMLVSLPPPSLGPPGPGGACWVEGLKTTVRSAHMCLQHPQPSPPSPASPVPSLGVPPCESGQALHFSECASSRARSFPALETFGKRRG